MVRPIHRRRQDQAKGRGAPTDRTAGPEAPVKFRGVPAAPRGVSAVLDSFFGNVCELDLVFNFYKVYAILDEVFLAGEIEETSKQVVLTRLEHLDKLE
ncbi:hypothetical protein V496_02367 [Pseudogymnoascus sp. VKM F-4515 (FW-2607)]|nr:hypothetical protein V496_02367 [Pseudogymnoascus sp. VKM F-4515 (FW-2607)]KFY99674.1 hypothetical protein V498_00576 [Pseudogymnoascus sp. VKM F-4517 (FW-2822)]